MDTSMVFPNMQRDLTFQPQLATLPPTQTHTVFTTRMFSNTTRHPPCHFTDPSHSCMHTLPTLRLQFSMLWPRRHGLISRTLPQNLPKPTGYLNLAFWMFS